MYFKDRIEAGRKLAAKLDDYKTKNPVILALSESSVLVAAQIAMHLHTDLYLYAIRNISLPGEFEPVAAMSSTGIFRYNDDLSNGQIDEIKGEFRNHIEQERMYKRHELNVLLGKDGEIHRDMLRHRDIILVADALSNGIALAMAADYLKTIAIGKIIVAVPVCTVPALDKMHVMADELHVMGVTDNFISINHYYDDNHILTADEIMKVLRNLTLTWTRSLGPVHAKEHHARRHKRSNVLIRDVVRPTRAQIVSQEG